MDAKRYNHISILQAVRVYPALTAGNPVDDSQKH